MAFFITFEGVEGCGKSTQARILYRKLSQKAIPSVLLCEPGITPLGKRLSHWLKLHREIPISPLSEVLLFNSSLTQLVMEFIQPNLKAGKIVICDRYADSTTAYQGYGRELDLALIETINNISIQQTKPNLTILLDIPAEIGFVRKKKYRQDRFEQEDMAFHCRVRKGYLQLALKEPKRWLVIDANQSKLKITEIIWEQVSYLLNEIND